MLFLEALIQQNPFLKIDFIQRLYQEGIKVYKINCDFILASIDDLIDPVLPLIVFVKDGLA